MDSPIRDALHIFIMAVITAAFLLFVLPLVNIAREEKSANTQQKALSTSLKNNREWIKCEGAVNGADMIGFITLHKYACDIVIRNYTFGVLLIPMLTDGALVYGLADNINLPDYYWDTAFLYDVVLSGHGDRNYIATLLYDGQLTPGVGQDITGIEYREVTP